MNAIKTLTLFGILMIGTSVLAQTVTTFAGKVNDDYTSNLSNSDVDKANAYFYYPEGICWDGNGKMYIAEKNKIRMMDGSTVRNRSGKLGDPTFSHGYNNGTGNAAAYFAPSGLVSDDDDNIYIVDSENHCIRKMAPFVNAGNGQIVTTFAGSTSSNDNDHKDGTGTSARFDSPKGIAMDANGNMYVTDYFNDCIRKITPAGVVTTLAGKPGVSGSDDGTGGVNCTFNGPYGIAILDANTLIITDKGNSSIRKVNMTSGSTTTICGKLGQGDGTYAQAGFRAPQGLAVVDGLVYIADANRVRLLDLTNETVSTFAGSASAVGTTDGNGPDAKFVTLSSIAYDGNNALYVTDTEGFGSYNNVIRKITIDNLAPVADFTATKTILVIDQESTLTDISGGKEATSRKWTIVDKASGSAANVTIVSGDLNASENITVKFKSTGFYTVTLEVTNEFGTNKKEVISYFNVSTTGSVASLSGFDVNVYPNPSTDVIHISSTTVALEQASISLINAMGQEMYAQKEINGNEHSINVREFAPGIYFLHIKSEKISGLQRVIIQ
ncbi:MAG: PKD repeat protein [Bacteroidia bacterium]|jgi:PKD repeat protein